jgi:hypothetical protein
MVIFHSYVKLPEGKFVNSDHRFSDRIEVSKCWKNYRVTNQNPEVSMLMVRLDIACGQDMECVITGLARREITKQVESDLVEPSISNQ